MKAGLLGAIGGIAILMVPALIGEHEKKKAKRARQMAFYRQQCKQEEFRRYSSTARQAVEDTAKTTREADRTIERARRVFNPERFSD
jgi:hypothetical protein